MSKRKHQSTVTLHDFFKAAAPTPISVKGKKATAKRKPQETPRNVIVIDDSDSDSEPEVLQVVHTKKRRNTGYSSDGIEFVETESTSARCTTTKCISKGDSSQKGLDQTSSSRVDPSVSREHVPNTIAPKDTGYSEVFNFGTPSLLLSTGMVTPPEKPLADDLSPFGRPTLLLSTNNHASGSSNPSASSGLDIYATTEAPDNIDDTAGFDIPVHLDDEWGLGDDEKVSFMREPDGLEEEDGLSNLYREDEPDVTKCPSCDRLLDGLSHLDLVRHVNDCLDAGGGPSEESASSSSKSGVKVLQPLSSLDPPKLHAPVPPLDTGDVTKASISNGNAFSVLMSSHKESEAWKEAAIAEDRSFRPNKRNGGRRKAPFYKVLQGMPIAVDAFCYGTIPGVTAYFLTHAHSDHYTNLSSNWKSGPIYCSEGTANLIIHMLSVDQKWVHPLPYDVPTEIPNTGGVCVTLIEANHCPGSCLFFYEGVQTVNAGDSSFKSPFIGSTKPFRYLHCGDFRASPRHILHPAIKGKRIDHVYLDTTYLDPKYTFPPQPLVISACAELARRLVAGEPTGNISTTMHNWATSTSAGKQPKAEKMLIVVGTYSIGKERIVKAIAHALNSKVYCDARKAAILRCQADAELDALLTPDPLNATVHLVPLGSVTSDKLKIYVERFKSKFTKAVGFRPTGWTFTPPSGIDSIPTIPSIISRPYRDFTHANLHPARNSTSTLQLYPVPYSEHSSFFELTCFAMSFNWGKMIATVNVGSETSRGKMAKWVARWEAERKKRGQDVVIPHRDSDYW